MVSAVHALRNIITISKLANVNQFVLTIKLIRKLQVFVYVKMVTTESIVDALDAKLGKFMINNSHHV